MTKARLWTRREFGWMVGLAGLSAGVSSPSAQGMPVSDFLSGISLEPSPAIDKRAKLDKPESPNLNGPNSLKAHAANAGLLFGFAVRPEKLKLSADAGRADVYTATVMEQANIIVAENAMKWSSLRPAPTTFDFVNADRLFAFAAQNGQLVRGHNLCWHEQLPEWFATAATKDNARDLLTQHIQTVAGRYAGRVHSWDVVNEAVHVPDGRPDGLRKSPWLELIGPGYIELAFTAAGRADPKARLTYNDYDIELDTSEQAEKRAQVLMLVKRLHARGVPIQAVGIQSHLQANGPRPGTGLVSFIRTCAQMGLEVYVTELDVNSHALPGGPELQDEAVAQVYSDYLNLVLREPNVKAVLAWGVSDAGSWLNHSKQPWATRPDGARQKPLPFEDNYSPAPAFFATRNAFDSAHSAVPQDSTKCTDDVIKPFAVPGSPVPVPQPH